MKYQLPTDEQYRQGMKTDLRLRLALSFLDHWGMVTGFRGKEDSSGRAGLDLLSVEDTVTRAFDMAEMAVEEAENRGWLAEFDMDPIALHQLVGEYVAAKEEAVSEARDARVERGFERAASRRQATNGE